MELGKEPPDDIELLHQIIKTSNSMFGWRQYCLIHKTNVTAEHISYN
jgi:hypothetical protein